MSTTTIRERPVIFSGPMVRAILAGRKTQTRRAIKPQPNGIDIRTHQPIAEEDAAGVCWSSPDHTLTYCLPCPYGKPGDRLWVRETWADAMSDAGPCICYRANLDRRYLSVDSWPIDYDRYPGCKFANWASDLEGGVEGLWRSPIHMPRWASRITLQVESVRVERLQEISEADAIAEVVDWNDGPFRCGHTHPISAFRSSWDHINDRRGFPWEANPWVWVIGFSVTEGKGDRR